MMAGIDGARGPRQRGEEQRQGADGIDAVRASQMLRTDQQRHPTEAQNETGNDPGTGAGATRAQPFDQNHPQRDRSDQESGDSGGYGLLGPRDHAIATEEQEAAGNDGGLPLSQGGLLAGKPLEKRIEDQPYGEVAQTGHQEGRNGLDTDTDGEVGGAPKDVDRGEGE